MSWRRNLVWNSHILIQGGKNFKNCPYRTSALLFWFLATLQACYRQWRWLWLNCIYFGVQDSWTFEGPHWRVWDSSLSLWCAMAVMAFIPQPCSSQGKMMCWHRWIFCPFWWSSEFAWATQPSAGLLARAAPGVPRSALKKIQGCHAGLKSHGKPGGRAGNRAAMSTRAAFCAHYQFWAQQQHWQDRPRHCLQESLLPLRSPKIQLKLTTCGCTFFSRGDYLGWKCLLLPSISFSALLAFSCWDLI